MLYYNPIQIYISKLNSMESKLFELRWNYLLCSVDVLIMYGYGTQYGWLSSLSFSL